MWSLGPFEIVQLFSVGAILWLIFTRNTSRPPAPSDDTRLVRLETKLRDLEANVDQIAAGLGIEPRQRSPRDDQLEAIRDLLRRHNKIEAIKLYRERTGVGLKEAKDYDSTRAKHRRAGRSVPDPGLERRGGAGARLPPRLVGTARVA